MKLAHFYLRKPDDKERACNYIQAMPDKPLIEVLIRPVKGRRSEQRSRLWHLWIDEIALQTSNSPAYIKVLLKAQFGPIITSVKRGEQDVPILKSTADYSNDEFDALMHQTQQWAANNQLMLTQPEVALW